MHVSYKHNTSTSAYCNINWNLFFFQIGSITRASKVDFEELAKNIVKMEIECKSSWDHLKAIAKHDGPTQIKLKWDHMPFNSSSSLVTSVLKRLNFHISNM